MEPEFQEDAHEEPLLAGFDRLALRLDETLALVVRLRSERDGLAAQRDGLCREAGVKSGDGLTGVIARWKSLEQENRTLQREREAIAKRLSGLLEKVDLLQRGA
jgi:hypothetical protein